MNALTEKRKGFRVNDLKDYPDHWVLTELDDDGDHGGKALRKPDGTFWEVVATHIMPPGGALYQVDIGNQITDRKQVQLLESFYTQARANIDTDKSRRFVQRFTGRGKLIFDVDDEAAEVTYQIDEFVPHVPGPTIRRGQVSHAVGHTDWHPIVGEHLGPFTLVMDDGRKLKVFFRDLKGSVASWGDFF